MAAGWVLDSWQIPGICGMYLNVLVPLIKLGSPWIQVWSLSWMRVFFFNYPWFCRTGPWMRALQISFKEEDYLGSIYDAAPQGCFNERHANRPSSKKTIYPPVDILVLIFSALWLSLLPGKVKLSMPCIIWMIQASPSTIPVDIMSWKLRNTRLSPL